MVIAGIPPGANAVARRVLGAAAKFQNCVATPPTSSSTASRVRQFSVDKKLYEDFCPRRGEGGAAYRCSDTALPRPVTTIYEKRAGGGRRHCSKPRRTEQAAAHTPPWGIERSGKESGGQNPSLAKPETRKWTSGCGEPRAPPRNLARAVGRGARGGTSMCRARRFSSNVLVASA